MWTEETLIRYRLERGWPPLADAERVQVLALLNTMAQAFKGLPFFGWAEPEQS